MAGIKDWINARNIDLHLTAGSELETIVAMLQLAEECVAIEDIEQLSRAVFRREIMHPSPTGCCTVVFRALSDVVAMPKMFFGRFEEGIGYYSKKGRPVDLVVLIIAPPSEKKNFRRMVRAAEWTLCRPSVLKKLRAAGNPEEALQVFLENIKL